MAKLKTVVNSSNPIVQCALNASVPSGFHFDPSDGWWRKGRYVAYKGKAYVIVDDNDPDGLVLKPVSGGSTVKVSDVEVTAIARNASISGRHVVGNSGFAKNAEPEVEDAVRKALHDSLGQVLRYLRSVMSTVHGQTASVVVDVVPKELSPFFRELTDPKTLSMLDALVRRLA